MQSLLAEKDILRRTILSIRENTDRNVILINSDAIIKKILSMDLYKKSKVIMSYINIRNEVITKEFINESLKQNKRVVVPWISAEDNSDGNMNIIGRKRIFTSEICDSELDLRKGLYGIPEPISKKRLIFEPENIDLVVVPGIVFDINKNRIGYGAGFFDNFLKRTKNDCIKIGLAFDFQVLDVIPAEDYDIPLDIIITEKRIIR